MAAQISPIAKQVYICDDVQRDAATGKVNLYNLWESVRVPTTSSFPYSLASLSVFVYWRDGYGKVKTRVDIVQASSENVIFRTKNHYLNFEQQTKTIHARYKIEKCTFPEPDFYYVEVYCEELFVDDQIIQVYQE